MSVNGSTGILSDGYADIESMSLNIGQSFTGSNTTDVIVTKVSEQPTGDLDRNELAELVLARLAVTTSVRDEAADEQSQTGNVRNDISAFINQQENAQAPDELETFVDRGSPTDVNQAGSVRLDNAGQLFKMNHVVHPQFLDATSGAGGGSDGGETDEYLLNFAELGGGPVLDRFDDIVLRSALKASNVVTQAKTEVRLQCWFKVEEFEDRGIQSFGRP